MTKGSETGVTAVYAISITQHDRYSRGVSAMKTRTAPPIRPAPKHNRFPGRTIRAFLAEDSPLLMLLLARIVSRDERVFIVGAVADGRKAVGNARSLQPDLVITDLHLPGLDGAEATRLLKHQPDPPIIFVVTSDDNPEARSRSLAAGADAFLVKSANLAPQLLSTIREFFPEEPRSDDRKTRHVCESLTPAE
jgi:DNA-binding NarL/FixJ family response regulator